MYKLLVVAPYEGLKELVAARAHQYANFRIDIELGNLEQGVDIARRAQREQQYDIIMSRGGTSQMIERDMHIPVVDIAVSSYDFLRVMHLAQTVSGKAALVGFPNIIQSAATACDIQKIHIDMFAIQGDASLEKTLLSLKKKGYSVFVGDLVTVRAAKRMGLHSILLTSGVESIDAAFAQAETILRHVAYFKEREMLSNTILDTLEERVLLYDENRTCLFRSKSVTSEDERLAMDYLSSGRIRDRSARMRSYTIEKGTRTYDLLHGIPRTASDHIEGVCIHNAQFQQAPFEYLDQSMARMRKIADKAKKFAGTDRSVLVLGANGTGRERLAMALYEASAFNAHPLVRLDCAAIAERGWRELLDSTRSILLEPECATLYVRNVHRMPHSAQVGFSSFLEAYRSANRFRVLSSAVGSIDEMVAREAFYYPLFRKLSDVRISLPCLKERKADIPNLVGFAIEGANAQYGTQVIALEPDALALLLDYDWPRNIDQLVQGIETLVLSAKGHYIGVESVRDLVNSQPPEAPRSLSLDKSLNEIVRDVLAIVLEQEGGKQTAAAKRLGISRSTLWRKLDRV